MNEAAMRTLARVVYEQGERRGLLAFGAADNHLHAELAADHETVAAFARYLATSLRWRLALPVPFERARIRPLADQGHAYNTFRYVQRQDAHHAVDRDPGRDATSLPDLLGLRVLSTRITARVRTHFPRLTRDDLLALFPAAMGGLDAANGLSAAQWAEAATAAFALPSLCGHGGDVTRARRAAVHAAGVSMRPRDLADALTVSTRTVRSLRSERSEEAAVRAVVLQARMRAGLRC